MAVEIDSKNIKSIDYVTEHDDLNLLPGLGAMVVTFRRNGQQYLYYPMVKEVYDFHEKRMANPPQGESANDHFRKNIENLYDSKKI